MTIKILGTNSHADNSKYAHSRKTCRATVGNAVTVSAPAPVNANSKRSTVRTGKRRAPDDAEEDDLVDLESIHMGAFTESRLIVGRILLATLEPWHTHSLVVA